MERQPTIQGTDGVRGKIAYGLPQGETPLSCFQKYRILTPIFFQEYTYIFGCLLQEKGLAKKGDIVILGEDSRDKEGFFLQAASSGLVASGLTVWNISCLPTPAVVLYMLSTQVAASVMLTASHNPSDQHGIKLFLGTTGLKFFPYDDSLLTNKLLASSGILTWKAKEVYQKEVLDKHSEAKNLLIQTLQDTRNIGNDKNTKNIKLVIDAANGAAAPVVKELFPEGQFNSVLFCNTEGCINEKSGVASLEGYTQLTKEEISNPTGLFFDFPLWQNLLKLTEDEEVKQGKLEINAFVFDGDADRCYAIDYNKEKEIFFISNGDLLALQISQTRRTKSKEELCVCTIESDIDLYVNWKKQDFQVEVSAVGDKWILRSAFQSQVELVSSQIKTQEAQKIYTKLKQNLNSDMVSAMLLTQLWQQLETGLLTTRQETTSFLLGAEASGHIIVPTYIKNKQQQYSIGYVGNGIQAALLSLYSIATREEQNLVSWQVNLPVYYVNKSFLTILHTTCIQLQKILEIELNKQFNYEQNYVIVQETLQQEPNMLFFNVYKNKTKILTLFIRNSGTEDKASLSVSCLLEYKKQAQFIAQIVHVELLFYLKIEGTQEALLQKQLIQACLQKETSKETQVQTVLAKRVLYETEHKEKLICKKENGYMLTQTGVDLQKKNSFLFL